MDICECTAFSRCFYIVKRAARSLFGVVLLGVLCSFVMKMFQDEIGLGSCRDIEREIQKLRAECGARNAQRRGPCHTKTADVGNRDDVGCKPKNMDDEIKSLIRRELELYANDKTGMADFALENLGACVISTRDTKEFKDDTQTFFGYDFMGTRSDPNQILRPVTVPGKCWAFSGCTGTAVIRLMGFVHITHITLEHISPLMTPTGEISSAPKTFILRGLDDVSSTDGRHKFGTFIYKKEGPTVQTFPIQSSSSRSFRIVEVVFQDNHGNPHYTCVYRVRVHGKIDIEKGKSLPQKNPDN